MDPRGGVIIDSVCVCVHVCVCVSLCRCVCVCLCMCVCVFYRKRVSLQGTSLLDMPQFAQGVVSLELALKSRRRARDDATGRR